MADIKYYYYYYYLHFLCFKMCIDSCWVEICATLSTAAASCTTLVMVQIWLMVEVQEWKKDERSRRRRLIGIIEVRQSSTAGEIGQKKRRLDCKRKEEKYHLVKNLQKSRKTLR